MFGNFEIMSDSELYLRSATTEWHELMNRFSKLKSNKVNLEYDLIKEIWHKFSDIKKNSMTNTRK